ncbi:hypothetical protein Acr_06g0014820 [Actinidia rufa]|uniref:Uncharacterized protein n=1 Tax=Actinidia rufa TaxID=165716 RepID=A0A7J0ET77_9ERIC|nr:hypothetical protein Acr_06g0014820 [Actinidia rufa]
MAWRGSLSRSVIATAWASIRTSPPLPRLRPPPLAAPRLQSRRLSFTNPRLRAITFAAVQRNTPHIALGRQRSSLLRVVSRYLLPYLSGSLVVSLIGDALSLLISVNEKKLGLGLIGRNGKDG